MALYASRNLLWTCPQFCADLTGKVRNTPSLLPMSAAVREKGNTPKTQGPYHMDQPIQVIAGFPPIMTAPFHLLG